MNSGLAGTSASHADDPGSNPGDRAINALGEIPPSLINRLNFNVEFTLDFW